MIFCKLINNKVDRHRAVLFETDFFCSDLFGRRFAVFAILINNRAETAITRKNTQTHTHAHNHTHILSRTPQPKSPPRSAEHRLATCGTVVSKMLASSHPRFFLILGLCLSPFLSAFPATTQSSAVDLRSSSSLLASALVEIDDHALPTGSTTTPSGGAVRPLTNDVDHSLPSTKTTKVPDVEEKIRRPVSRALQEAVGTTSSTSTLKSDSIYDLIKDYDDDASPALDMDGGKPPANGCTLPAEMMWIKTKQGKPKSGRVSSFAIDGDASTFFAISGQNKWAEVGFDGGEGGRDLVEGVAIAFFRGDRRVAFFDVSAFSVDSS